MRTLANLQADLATALALGLPKNLNHHGHQVVSEGAETRLRSGLVITITHENAKRFVAEMREAQHG